MAVVRPIRAAIPEPIGLHTQAMDNLRYIRDAIENAGSFTGVPGVGGMLVGATAFFAVPTCFRVTASFWGIDVLGDDDAGVFHEASRKLSTTSCGRRREAW